MNRSIKNERHVIDRDLPNSVKDNMQSLSSRYAPPTWMFECDEDLVHYFYDHIGKEDENLGSVKQCVTSIDVSSSSVCEGYHFV